MKIVDDIDLDKVALPRLADFYKWGIAFSKVLGYGQQRFERAFNLNKSSAPEIISNKTALIKLIDEYLNDNDKWSGTASEFRSKLIKFADDNGLNTDVIPDSSDWLSRRLNKYSEGDMFLKIGIKFEKERKASKKLIKLSK